MTGLGPLGALSSSITWAYASARYAQAARDVGPARVNFLRALTVVPIYALAAWWLYREDAFKVGWTAFGWLSLSMLCSYGIADSMFFTATRRIGISTALSIASIYPMWATLFGVFVRHEPFGLLRGGGIVLCIGGVIALVRLSHDNEKHKVDATGVILAIVTSVLWAGNTITVKLGSENVSIPQVNAVRFLVALVLLAPQVALTRPPTPTPIVRAWVRILPAIGADALVGSVAYVYGLAHSHLAVGATLSSLSPLISVPIAILFGEEKWSTARFLAIVATVSGVILLVTSAG